MNKNTHENNNICFTGHHRYSVMPPQMKMPKVIDVIFLMCLIRFIFTGTSFLHSDIFNYLIIS